MSKKLDFVPMYEIGQMSPLYPCIENGLTSTNIMPKLGFYADKHFLLYSNFDLATAYYEKDEMLRAGEYTFKRLSNPKHFNTFVGGVQEVMAKIQKFLNKLSSLDVWALPQAEILDLLIENSQLEADIFAYYNNTQPQNFAVFEQKITTALHESGLGEDKIMTAMSVLATSEAPTRLSQEESDWLNLVLVSKRLLPVNWHESELEKNYPRLYKRLSKHFDLYKTLLIGDGNWQPEIRHYFGVLRNDIVKPTKEINDRLKELQEFASKTLTAKKNLIRELSLNDDIVFYARVISEIGHLRLMMRIDGFIPLAYGNDRPIVEALARTYKLSGAEFRYLTYNELLSLRTKQPVPNLESVLKQRLKDKNYLLVVNNRKYKMLFGKEANATFAKLAPVVNRYTVDELQGNTAMSGRVKGVAAVFNWGEDLQRALAELPKNAILIAGQTRPQLMPLIRASMGIITDEGGVMSHAAIVARELKLPCVVGTKIATKVLRSGDLLELDADHGLVKIIKRANRVTETSQTKTEVGAKSSQKQQSMPSKSIKVKHPVLMLKEIIPGQTKLVGGKGSSLAALTQAGLPVPPGFVVTTECFRAFWGGTIPEEVQQIILTAFKKLRTDHVAVRSSAVAEDSINTSWAGQFETLLNVTEDGLINAIQTCWSSTESDLVQAYAKDNKIKRGDLALAIVVQTMVASDVSGVVFTCNPVTGNNSEIMVEACFGLGEMLVQGMVTPDNFLLNKSDLELRSHTANKQLAMLTYAKGGSVEKPVINPEASKITKDQLTNLGVLAKRIEDYYGQPQDIEWAMSNGHIYIVQSRPITTLSVQSRHID